MTGVILFTITKKKLNLNKNFSVNHFLNWVVFLTSFFSNQIGYFTWQKEKKKLKIKYCQKYFWKENARTPSDHNSANSLLALAFLRPSQEYPREKNIETCPANIYLFKKKKYKNIEAYKKSA